MVNFYNIRVEGEYIYADAWNEMNDVKESIKAKLDGSYHSSKDSDIIKATWNIIIRYKDINNIPKETSVAWG